MPGIAEDTTAIIKTFERPQCVQRLVDSIRTCYPDMRILVADDSRRPIAPRGVDEYVVLPFDSGLSAGRNALLERVRTPFLLLLDDDVVFDERTRLEQMSEVLQATAFNLVGGDMGWRWHGTMELEGPRLHLYLGRDRGTEEGHPVYDFVHNFFMARADTVKQIRWDPRLKVFEHSDFFLRGRDNLRVTRVDVAVRHEHSTGDARQDRRYLRFRNRKRFLRLSGKTHGFKKQVIHKPAKTAAG